MVAERSPEPGLLPMLVVIRQQLTQTITVKDNIAPVLVGVPANINCTVWCDTSC